MLIIIILAEVSSYDVSKGEEGHASGQSAEVNSSTPQLSENQESSTVECELSKTEGSSTTSQLSESQLGSTGLRLYKPAQYIDN